MLGDVLLIEDKHMRVGGQIADEILKRRKDKYICAISGESGSGKSELANVIGKALRNAGVSAKAISTDNYYRTDPRERTEWRLRQGIEKVVGYEEYDWPAIEATIESFKNNRTASLPCVDLITNRVDTLTTNFEGIDVLILDGLYAIKSSNVDLKIFIELTYHQTKKAQVTRGKEPQNEYRMRVLEQEHKMVSSLKAMADLLVSQDYELKPPQL